MSMHKIEVDNILKPCIRGEKGFITPSRETFFGETLLDDGSNGSPKATIGNNTKDATSISVGAMKSQHLVQELYESRVASAQRFVAMCIMFHSLGSSVQNFFSVISFGLLGYRTDRSHSIMRIASTASPISAAEIRERAKIIFYTKKVRSSLDLISSQWLDYKKRTKSRRITSIHED
mmetsp:Transcript_1392/g.1678  ORF Transcript_1392/g.1678 Transcript_1392/m.1678 type:complete len:177 (+) Transcript_1392:457-987(+)